MDIAIIGTGNVGSALGSRWARLGHTVTYGSRSAGSERVTTLLAESPGAAAATPRAAAAAAEVVVLATPFATTPEIARGLGDLAGKILIDASNPIRDAPAGNSGAEAVAEAAPGARVVKAFNSTGAENMRDPLYDGEPVDMFVCGDDEAARAVAARLAEELGFRAVDCGGLENAALLEHLAKLWVHLAYGQGRGRDIAFRLVRR